LNLDILKDQVDIRVAVFIGELFLSKDGWSGRICGNYIING
jgi:hypothetical protein